MNHCECGCNAPHCWSEWNRKPMKRNILANTWEGENKRRYKPGGRRGPVETGTRIPTKAHYGKYKCLWFANKTANTNLPEKPSTRDEDYGWDWQTKQVGDCTHGYITKDKTEWSDDLMTFFKVRDMIGKNAWATPCTEEQGYEWTFNVK